ncbi:methyltransferase domain-containing protein [bacterium]|nr:methyltransferase domain-containing protein [bacterium]
MKKLNEARPWPLSILMIAPEPFFTPRGTPFSVYFRIKALTDLGHQVDLVTYHLGQDPKIDGLNIFRIAAFPGVKRIAIGPSWSKILLDILVFFKAWSLLRNKNYHIIHTHEEASFMGTIFRWYYRIPHLYDMHSDLAQQLANFKMSGASVLAGLVRIGERWVINHSDFIIGICTTLGETIRSLNANASWSIIENSPLPYKAELGDPELEQRVEQLLQPIANHLIIYTGTVEVYQGLDLLMDAAEKVIEVRTDICFVIIGGSADQVRELQAQLDRRGLSASFRLIGQRPPEEIPYFLDRATMLVSPRIRGTNTPLKIYSYLASGVPIVATDLLTHTQVLDHETALLVAPGSEALAHGILTVLDQPELGHTLATAAEKKYRECYSYDIYLTKVSAAMETAMANWEKKSNGLTHDHYTTRLYRQKKFARSFDDERFGSVFGHYLSNLETLDFRALLGPSAGVTILDAGGGTGRIALPLTNDGAQVTIIDTSIEMMAIAREKTRSQAQLMNLVCGSVAELPFADQSFDWLISSRVLMHVPQWRNTLSEFCRVSRVGLIFDFPPLIAFPALAVPFLWLKKFFSRKTQNYIVIHVSQVISELGRHGFFPKKIQRRFFLPIGFYRKINSPTLTMALEKMFRILHLTSFFGAPVTLCAVRAEQMAGFKHSQSDSEILTGSGSSKDLGSSSQIPK